MCGIAGLVNFKQDIVQDKEILEKMIKTLERRGPDAKGYYISSNVLLGHRRLIVVDPEGGLQPMTKIFQGKKYTLVYNGELYNTEDLRKELKKQGFTFDSYSTCHYPEQRERLDRRHGMPPPFHFRGRGRG